MIHRHIAVIAFLLPGVASATDNFDGTSKVGSCETTNDTRYTCALNSTPSNTLSCFFSSDGTSWTTANLSMPFGVIKPAYTNTTLDELDEYYIDDGDVGQIPGWALPGGIHGPTKLGPRLGVALSGTTAWVFGIVPNTSTQIQGHLLAASIANSGAGALTWSDITGAAAYDKTSGPIAAANSMAYSEPIVAVRLDSTHIAFLYYDGANWNELDSAALPGGNVIGNSIAIAPTPAHLSANGWFELYENIFVASPTNHHLYQTSWSTCVSCIHCACGPHQLNSWHDLGTLPTGRTLDTSSDSIAASAFTDGSGKVWETLYVRATDASNNSYSYTADFDDVGSVSGAGWLNMGVTVAYAGLQSVYPATEGITGVDEMYGICPTTITTEICQANRAHQGTAFTWIDHPSP